MGVSPGRKNNLRRKPARSSLWGPLLQKLDFSADQRCTKCKCNRWHKFRTNRKRWELAAGLLVCMACSPVLEKEIPLCLKYIRKPEKPRVRQPGHVVLWEEAFVFFKDRPDWRYGGTILLSARSAQCTVFSAAWFLDLSLILNIHKLFTEWLLLLHFSILKMHQFHL